MYYLLFSVLLQFFYAKSWGVKSVYGLIFIGIAIFLGNQIMIYFLIWLAGALLSFKPVRLRGYAGPVVYGAAVAVAIVSLKALYLVLGVDVKDDGPYKFVSDLSVGLSFTFLIYLMLSRFNELHAARNRILDAIKYAAGFSYTLYLVHEPVLNFLNSARTVDSSLLNTPNAILKLALKGVIFFRHSGLRMAVIPNDGGAYRPGKKMDFR